MMTLATRGAAVSLVPSSLAIPLVSGRHDLISAESRDLRVLGLRSNISMPALCQLLTRAAGALGALSLASCLGHQDADAHSPRQGCPPAPPCPDREPLEADAAASQPKAEAAPAKFPCVSEPLDLYRGHAGTLSSPAWSPDASMFAVSHYQSVEVWIPGEDEPLSSCWGPDDVYLVGFTPRGELVSAGGWGSLWVRDPLTCEPRLKLPKSDSSDKATTYFLKLSSDGKLALTGGKHRAKLWDLESGGLRASVESSEQAGKLTAVAMVPGRSLMFTGSVEGELRAFDTETGDEIARRRYPPTIISIVPSGDGSRVAVAAGSEVTILDTAKLQPEITVDSMSSIRYVALSDDGTRLVTAHFGARVWSIPEGELLEVLADDISVRGLALSSGQGLVALTTNDALHAYELDSGVLIGRRSLTQTCSYGTLALSPDGRLLSCVLMSNNSGAIHWCPRAQEL